MANGLGEYFGQGALGAPQAPSLPAPAVPHAFEPPAATRTSVLAPPPSLPQLRGATGEYFAQNGMGEYFSQNGLGAMNLGPVPGARKPGTFRRAAAGVSPFAGALGEMGDAISDARAGAITGLAAGTTVTVLLIGLGLRFGAGWIVGKALAPSGADENKYAWGGALASTVFGSVGLGVEALIAANARK